MQRRLAACYEARAGARAGRFARAPVTLTLLLVNLNTPLSVYFFSLALQAFHMI